MRSVSKSECNEVDALLIAHRSWMWLACLRSDVFVFLILQRECKHTHAVYPTDGLFSSTTLTQAFCKTSEKSNIDR